ncbi:MAG: MFS transporter [Chloroflexota bacterium]|nr:MFS transporter [Chloroflexota bacterium]
MGLPFLATLPLAEDRKRILGWMCLLIAVNQLGFGTIVPVVPLYAESFGVSAAAVGLTIAIYGLARFLVNVPAGSFADRNGRRWTLAVGGLVTVLGNLLCAAAWNYPLFLVARFVAGAGAAMVLTGGQIVLADIASPQNRGRVMALYQGVFLFAVGAGPLPGGVLAAHLGLRAPFLANAALAGVVALVAWFQVPETRDLRADRQTAARHPAPPLRDQLRVLQATPGFLLISLVSFVAFSARTGALFNIIPLLAESKIGLGPDQIGLGLGLISIVGLILAYPSGVLVDRFGRKAVIVPATAMTGAAMLLFAGSPSYALFLLACGLWSVASGIGSSAPAAYAADTAPPGMMASALGTYRTIADLGYVVGPLALGAMADLASPEAALASIATLLFLSAAAFAYLAPESLEREPSGTTAP